MSSEVFVSYRWGNGSRDAVWRLATELKKRLGRSCVHVDIENRASGENLKNRIQREVRESRTVVVAIHPDWIDEAPRLFESNDLVRLEIEAALELGLPIVPVLLNGAHPPNRGQLPESLHELCDMHMFSLGEHANYDADIQDLAKAIKRIVGGRTLRYLTWFAEHGAWNIAFALAIVGALALFLSRMLEIHTFRFEARLDFPALQVDPKDKVFANVMREGGVLMAWNWVAVIVLITPLMVLLAHSTVRQAKELLDSLQLRKMIVYVGEHGEVGLATSRRIWESVARPTAMWCQVFIVIAVVIGVVQWWQYSGQWYILARGYVHELFMNTSTGPDWHVAWALGIPSLADSGVSVVAFALVMYLVYGVGSALTFSYYAFLFNFFSEMSRISSAAGTRSNVTLRLDLQDRASGGLAAFGRMQRSHAAFCYWSIFAMYLMALRNAYLPLTCRTPQVLVSPGASAAEVAKSCSSMPSFAVNIMSSFSEFIASLALGTPNLRLLFHTYSEQNNFVLGSMLHALLVAAFFFLISSRMKEIVESARGEASPDVAMPLIRSIQFENSRVLIILVLGALSTVFLNLGPVVVISSVALLIVEKLVLRRVNG